MTIDAHAPLVPEDLPWLAHTRYWARFTIEERLRANRLMGLLINELCLLVENALIRVWLPSALRSQALRRKPRIQARVTEMLADEQRHALWFSSFNRIADPVLYAEGDFAFVSLPAPWERMGTLIAHVPGAWYAAAWLVLATEEWCCELARALTAAPRGELGERDASYISLHRSHAHEEAAHVHLDEELLSVASRRLAATTRRLLVRSAGFALGELMRPRRGAARMVARFVKEHPRWQGEQRAMAAAVIAVGAQADYWQCRGVGGQLPRTAACASAWGASWPTMRGSRT